MIDLNSQHRDELVATAIQYMTMLEVAPYDPRAGAKPASYWLDLANNLVTTWSTNSAVEPELTITEQFGQWLVDTDMFRAIGGTTITVTRRWKSNNSEVEVGVTRHIKSSAIEVVRLTESLLDNELWYLYQNMPVKDAMSSTLDPAKPIAETTSDWQKMTMVKVVPKQDGTGRIVRFYSEQYSKFGVACYADSQAYLDFGVDELGKMPLGVDMAGRGYFTVVKNDKYTKVGNWKAN